MLTACPWLTANPARSERPSRSGAEAGQQKDTVAEGAGVEAAGFADGRVGKTGGAQPVLRPPPSFPQGKEAAFDCAVESLGAGEGLKCF